jgi:hypothetical protein
MGDQAVAQTTVSGAGRAGWVVAAVFAAIAIGQCTPRESSPISPNSAASSPALSRYVAARSLNCRVSSMSTARVIRSFSRDQLVTVTEEADGWSKVSGSPDCWVKASYLTPEPKAATRRTGGGASTGSASAFLPSQASSSRASSLYGGQSTPRSRKKRSRSRGTYYNEGCPCSGRQVCIGPRGGRYCITSGGNKRYGV